MGFAQDQKFPIVRCCHCDFVYAQHVLNDELLHYVYSTVISLEKVQDYRSQTVKQCAQSAADIRKPCFGYKTRRVWLFLRARLLGTKDETHL
jgi:hypothetical protein